MEMKVVLQKGDLRDLQIMRTKTGPTLPQKGDEQQSLQKQLNCIGRRATEISYLSGIRKWEPRPKKENVTVSQNLHKLSKLRVFPDFDLKFLCQFFVL